MDPRSADERDGALHIGRLRHSHLCRVSLADPAPRRPLVGSVAVAIRGPAFMIDANGTVPLRLGVKYEAEYLLGRSTRDAKITEQKDSRLARDHR